MIIKNEADQAKEHSELQDFYAFIGIRLYKLFIDIKSLQEIGMIWGPSSILVSSLLSVLFLYVFALLSRCCGSCSFCRFPNPDHNEFCIIFPK